VPPLEAVANPADEPSSSSVDMKTVVDGAAEAEAGGVPWPTRAWRSVGGALAAAVAPLRRGADAPTGKAAGPSPSTSTTPTPDASDGGDGNEGGPPAPSAVDTRPPWLRTASRRLSVALGAVSTSLTFISPLLCIGAGVWALHEPDRFVSTITARWVEVWLALLMLSMGLTLSLSDVWGALRRPWLVALSLSLEYGLAPLSAFSLGHIFRLRPTLRVGLTLMGSVNGGQASNLCTYIARGDTAISVFMTLTSSLLATGAIPLLSRIYLSGLVKVDSAGLARSTATFVLAPVAAGVTAKAVAGPIVTAAEPLLPLVGIAALIIITLGTTAGAVVQIKEMWTSAIAPVALFHAVGFWFGYGLARVALRTGHPVATAVAFEAGFKSPALSWVLAKRHFEDPAVQTASAVSIIVLVPMALGAAVAFRLGCVWIGGGGGTVRADGGTSPRVWPVLTVTHRYSRSFGVVPSGRFCSPPRPPCLTRVPCRVLPTGSRPTSQTNRPRMGTPQTMAARPTAPTICLRCPRWWPRHRRRSLCPPRRVRMARLHFAWAPTRLPGEAFPVARCPSKQKKCARASGWVPCTAAEPLRRRGAGSGARGGPTRVPQRRKRGREPPARYQSRGEASKHSRARRRAGGGDGDDLDGAAARRRSRRARPRARRAVCDDASDATSSAPMCHVSVDWGAHAVGWSAVGAAAQGCKFTVYSSAKGFISV